MIQIAFCTGRSDPRSSALSGVQSTFLDRVAPVDVLACRRNFPYVTGDAPYRRAPLVLASVRNAVDYLGSRRPQFVARYRPAVIDFVDRAEHTIFLAGSCGLELLTNLGLPVRTLGRVSVFAYGPVARSMPACRCFVVQGRRDWLSRAFVVHADRQVDCGHLDYLDNVAVRDACAAFIAAITAVTPCPSPEANEAACAST